MEKRPNQSTIYRRQDILKALRVNYGIVSRAARLAKITPQTHYNWYREDELYAEAVNLIKYESHEQFKDLVMEAVHKKIEEGNTVVIMMCYKSLYKDMPKVLEQGTPFKERIKVGIKVVSKPIHYAMDEETQAAVWAYHAERHPDIGTPT